MPFMQFSIMLHLTTKNLQHLMENGTLGSTSYSQKSQPWNGVKFAITWQTSVDKAIKPDQGSVYLSSSVSLLAVFSTIKKVQ